MSSEENKRRGVAHWEHVPHSTRGAAPGKRVGATFTCLEVEVHAKGISQKEAASLVSSDPQYGLFLFGGDDEDGNQTDALHIFFLQEEKWVQPKCGGKPPSKRSRHTANAVGGSRATQRLRVRRTNCGQGLYDLA